MASRTLDAWKSIFLSWPVHPDVGQVAWPCETPEWRSVVAMTAPRDVRHRRLHFPTPLVLTMLGIAGCRYLESTWSFGPRKKTSIGCNRVCCCLRGECLAQVFSAFLGCGMSSGGFKDANKSGGHRVSHMFGPLVTCYLGFFRKLGKPISVRATPHSCGKPLCLCYKLRRSRIFVSLPMPCLQM